MLAEARGPWKFPWPSPPMTHSPHSARLTQLGNDLLFGVKLLLSVYAVAVLRLEKGRWQQVYQELLAACGRSLMEMTPRHPFLNVSMGADRAPHCVLASADGEPSNGSREVL